MKTYSGAAGGGPIITIVATTLLLLPVLALSGWIVLTDDGRAAWSETLHQTPVVIGP